jgi:hypothetical protein
MKNPLDRKAKQTAHPRNVGKGRAGGTDEAGLFWLSLPFVLGQHDKRKLFLAMDWHCFTRYVY